MTTVIDLEVDSQETKHRFELYKELSELRGQVVEAGNKLPSSIRELHDDYVHSAQNLLHYLCLRRQDLRSIQNRLAAMGLSSLGRSESCVLSSLDCVLQVLARLLNEPGPVPENASNAMDLLMGQLTLEHHSNTLLGPPRQERTVRIMVTMPSEAAHDYALIHGFLNSGMDCMRINCAHDSPDEWEKMINHLRRAEIELGVKCRVAMDLAGPKLRTGPVKPGPEVVKVKPTRNDYGWITDHIRIWLSSAKQPVASPSEAHAAVTVEENWLTKLRDQDEIGFHDARGAKRKWSVVEISAHGAWVEGTDTAYIANGQLLTLERNQSSTIVGGIRPKPRGIMLKLGDALILTGEAIEGTPATYDSDGRVLSPAIISCTLPQVLQQVSQGQSIWFDDGKIGGIITEVRHNCILVNITQVRVQGRILRADKGINFPESKLSIPALTKKDQQDLLFAAKHADIIALSFVNDAKDVELLQSKLKQIGDRRPGIVSKIETRRGFINLPQILLSLMSWPSSGVMIARGDLAVECGFERMAEVQEEILWLCEAAHVPVIWATQVLESLVKEGLASRAEITDAAMSHRAECVMLNKGPHIDLAIKSLSDILIRMRHHQTKKRAMMRRLQVAIFE